MHVAVEYQRVRVQRARPIGRLPTQPERRH
jgi:hypothetical protein